MTGKTEVGASSPRSTMKMSPAARTRMRATEKDVYRYYNDMGKDRGNCTWGAGILAHKGICSEEELTRKVSATMVDQEFERRVAEAERYVHLKIRVPINQDQFDALVSLTYNAGIGRMEDTYSYINRNDFNGAANNIGKMIRVQVVVKGRKKYVVAPGLIKRRKEESAPFRLEQPRATLPK